MSFWKNFFTSTKIYNKIITKNQVYPLSVDKILLIEGLQIDGQKQRVYISLNNQIDIYDLEKLCDAVGWVRRPVKKVKIAIEHSFLTVSLFCDNDHKRQLIGFARATSDNAFNATIWDVVIHPEFQGHGLGKTLMNQTIKYLRHADISTITLFADPNVVAFYSNLGFVTDPDGVKGMFWYPL
uniref:N-acetyltransferase domain-containing protein n=1 Tax=Gastroclonium compressum TaxID=1852973 RepID=A0A173FZV0_GASCM|nr:hypothetical protein [Coeloseira compressa]ANH09548.1 hypothetical protein [Coeloseira compressa]